MSGVLSSNHDFGIKTELPVHSGKVRSVYWLTDRDSRRLIERRGYSVPGDADLAVMIVSDRLSAFDCIWQAEAGLDGVPGKGAALNAVSQFWFEQFADAGLARSHILEAQRLVVIEYTAFIWAAILGWWFFAEPVTARTLLGTGLIVLGCLVSARGR